MNSAIPVIIHPIGAGRCYAAEATIGCRPAASLTNIPSVTPSARAALLAFATVASRKAACVATPKKMTQASPNLSLAAIST